MKTSQLSLLYPVKQWLIMLRHFSKSMGMLFLFSILLFSSTSYAQVAPVNPPTGGFNIDGGLKAGPIVGDWLAGLGGGFVLNNDGSPVDPSKTFFVTDPFNSSSDIVFKDGSMAFDYIDNDLTWNTKSAPDKDDIGHGLFHITKDASNNTWIILAGDILSGNGNTYADFELLQNSVTRVGGSTSGGFQTDGPNGGRTVGDMLISVGYSGGGASSINFFRWTETSPGVFTYVAITDDLSGLAFAMTNSDYVDETYFDGFDPSHPNQYEPGTFVEAAVNITQVLNAIETAGCPPGIGVKTLWIKTKTSSSGNGTLKDLLEPVQLASLNIGKPTTTGASNCGPGSVTLTASPDGNISDFDLIWYDDADLTNQVNTGTTFTTPNLTASTTYYVVQKSKASGCSSGATSVTATINPVPDAPDVTVVNNCDGSSDLTASNYTGDLLWSTGATTASIHVTDAATYTVTQKVGDCTSAEGSGTSAPNTAPNAPDVTVVNNCDGSSDLTASNYTGDLLWSTGATTASIHVTDAATYTVTQKVGDCTSAEGSGTSAPNTAPNAPDVTVVNNCDGSSDLTASNYTGDLLWSTGATTASIHVTDAATYTVTQKVGDCTSAEGSGTSAPNTAPNAPDVTVVNNCDGSSDLTASNYTGDLLWSTGATTASIHVTDAATYTVTQKVGDCTSAEGSGTSAPNTAPNVPDVTVVNNCDGSSDLTASNYTGSLLWSTGATTASIHVTDAATYTVTQKVGDCTSAEGSGTSAPRTTPSAPSASGTTVCAPNSATATASGCTGTLKWYDAATGGNNVATGVSSVTTSTTKTYYVSCTNASGCESGRTKVTATVNICTGIYPTATDCNGFNSGTIQFLPKVCVATKTRQGVTTVTNATPGVFFYYTKITAPSSSFSVYIDQTQCGSLNRNFAVQKGQVLAFTNSCTKIAAGAQAATVGDGVITISKVHAGDIIVISVKYDVKSMVGATVTGALPVNCTDNFVARLGTTNAGAIISNTSTSILVTSNCSASALTSSASIAKTDIVIPKALQVKTYPNPYATVINFNVVSPVSGKALVEVYDLMGKRIAIVYSGNIDAEIARSIQYNVPAGNRVPMMYKITVGDKSAKGMILPKK